MSKSPHAGARARARRHGPLALFLIAVLALVGSFAARPTPAAANTADSFATRCGIRFCLDGKEYFFAGANAYDMFTFGAGSGDTETQYMDKARIDAHFARMAADGVDVARVWMFSHESWHGFEEREGEFNEQQYAAFDYIIESAKAHDLRLIPVFENYWEAYGGIDTRLRWEGLSGGQPGRAAFFDKNRCPGCFTSYKNSVSYALNRTNHYSGVQYKDEPAIFAWELMNEPRYEGQSAAENVEGTTLRAWVDEMGAFVKAIDPNHLLGAGIEGHGTQYGFGGDEGNPFVHIQQSPYVDFTSAHPYPTEHWADLSIEETKDLVRAWVRDSHEVVGKPFFMGEFNVHNVDRAVWWREIYTAFEEAGGDGSAFWWYQDRTIDGKFGVSAGAPELAVLRAHSDRMAVKSGLPGSTPSPTPTGPTESPSPTPTGPTTSPSPSPTQTGPTTPPTSPPAPAGCAVTYTLSDWGTTFNGSVTIRNTGPTPVDGWQLAFTFPGDQRITQMWNAVPVQDGRSVTAGNPTGYNVTIAPGTSVNFGFSGTSAPNTNGVPAHFTLNGRSCTTA
ncbi:cellulose binding domain-containing protein [Streptomyces sp. NPDC099050]|uniref:cellulose binding domain-containing protein n=1 Tax=Streptomyces sp. NPDC099050 TaxID=3366100 RepID=UPI0038204440